MQLLWKWKTKNSQLGKKSQLSHIFCFERNNDLASLVFEKGQSEGVQIALMSLALSLAKRIETQDYINEFLR